MHLKHVTKYYCEIKELGQPNYQIIERNILVCKTAAMAIVFSALHILSFIISLRSCRSVHK